ncbi:helix-turn-helix transcriptional regulator, partial [Blautia marasmi]|uniref:helix-turn-helix transcriptional regulator n=1 Tax=Blautia marasmi TaxID=1917868 RepID=UPI00266C5E2E
TEFQGSEVDRAYMYVESHLIEYIKKGQPKKIAEFLILLNGMNLPRGTLAESELRSIKNIFITSAGITRHIAIELGMNPELANAICDAYDRKVEKRNDHDGIQLYIFQMMMDFAARIGKLKEFKSTNPLVLATINDVTAHIYEPLSTSIVASRLGYSKEHLCRQFKSETGLTVQHYILGQKTEEAKDMLRHTNYSLSEIAVNLSFQSQSYFQKVFVKYTGVTPGAYRRLPQADLS